MEYQPRSKAVRQDITCHGLRNTVYAWGDSENPALVLLHGWMDTGLTFQMLADEMATEWYLLAPDWRGFGDSERAPGGYWFPDYYADLDCILNAFTGATPVRLVGHSMGGNIALMYAGIRPQRVCQVVSLDAYGLPDAAPEQAPERYRRWLDELGSTPEIRDYADLAAVAARIQGLAPRMRPEHAAFVANHWVNHTPGQGTYRLKTDPAHRRVNPVLYRRAETRACWQRITASCLLVLGEESKLWMKYRSEGFADECRQNIARFEETIIADCGHMLHWEQPQRLAQILAEFFTPATDRRDSGICP